MDNRFVQAYQIFSGGTTATFNIRDIWNYHLFKTFVIVR